MNLPEEVRNVADDPLCSVVQRGEETRELDYKGPSAWDESKKKACCELVKDIFAMANTAGGNIVIGVSERPGGWIWEGLADEQMKSWDTSRVNRFVQNYADPPLNLRLKKVVCEDKQYVVLIVPEFPTTPHICQKEFPDALTAPTLYVRTVNNESGRYESGRPRCSRLCAPF